MVRKFLCIIASLLLCTSAWAVIRGSGGGGGETNQELGYATVGASMGGSTSNRCTDFTVTEAFTAQYVNFYGRTSDEGTDGTFQGYILDDTDTQVGDCTPAADIVDGASNGWNVAEFTIPFALDPGDYEVCYSVSEAVRYYYDTGDGSTYVGQSACGTATPTASSNHTTITVSNYAAH